MYLYEKIEYNGHNINIYYDESPLDPRRDFDNLGTLYTAHRRYRPEKEFDEHFTVEEVFEDRWCSDFKESFLRRYIVVPVYLYDHSGLTVSTTPFSCPWDSGLFGILAVSLDKVRKEYGWKRITAERRATIEGYLCGEIKTLDQYYTGEVYGFEVTPGNDDKDVIESCWGFFGKEGLEQLIDECKYMIDNKAA